MTDAFLNGRDFEEIRQGGGEGERAERTVQRHHGVGCLGDRGDLLAFGDPPRVGEVGLHDREQPAAERVEEGSLAHPTLTGGDRYVGAAHDLLQRVAALTPHRPLSIEEADAG